MATADQQFCLRWNNHQSTLISVFDSLLENGVLVDCTLAAEGQYLKAHKVVLSACSPYLETLLSQHYEKHPIVILKDVKFTELKSMMDYMYRGEVNISQDQLGTFLKAAESLQIKGLSDNGDDGGGSTATKRQDTASRTSVTEVRSTETKRPAPSGDISDVSRDGSISPSSLRKRRRTRRPSTGDDPDLDNTNNSCDLPNLAQSTPLPVPSSTIVPTPVSLPKQIVKQEPVSINSVAPESGLLKEKIEPPSEPLLEPKTEYLDYMNNENSIEVEDLTLDDDEEELNSSMDNSRPGPSHGDMSNQGYPPWTMTGDQSGTDEIFMAAQQAVGAATGGQRDSQGGDDLDVKQIQPAVKEENTVDETKDGVTIPVVDHRILDPSEIKQEIPDEEMDEEINEELEDPATSKSDEEIRKDVNQPNSVNENRVEIYRSGEEEIIIPDMIDNPIYSSNNDLTKQTTSSSKKIGTMSFTSKDKNKFQCVRKDNPRVNAEEPATSSQSGPVNNSVQLDQISQNSKFAIRNNSYLKNNAGVYVPVGMSITLTNSTVGNTSVTTKETNTLGGETLGSQTSHSFLGTKNQSVRDGATTSIIGTSPHLQANISKRQYNKRTPIKFHQIRPANIQSKITLSPSQAQEKTVVQTSTGFTLQQTQTPSQAIPLQPQFAQPQAQTLTSLMQQYSSGGTFIPHPASSQPINNQGIVINQSPPLFAITQPVFVTSGAPQTSVQVAPPTSQTENQNMPVFYVTGTPSNQTNIAGTVPNVLQPRVPDRVGWPQIHRTPQVAMRQPQPRQPNHVIRSVTVNGPEQKTNIHSNPNYIDVPKGRYTTILPRPQDLQSQITNRENSEFANKFINQ